MFLLRSPLDQAMFKGASDDYCKFCSDDTGKLKTYSEVQRGIAEWFKMWQPDVNEAIVLSRAAHYMKSMPAWAEN